MHPITHAAARPDHAAIVNATTGDTVTYGELDAFANRMARWLRARGATRGNSVGLLLENRPLYLQLVWAAQRMGAMLVPIATRLTAPEIGYILKDAECAILLTSPAFADVSSELAQAMPDLEIVDVDDDDFTAEVAAQPAGMIEDPVPGQYMLYSSGTTGRPKGVRRELPDPDLMVPDSLLNMAISKFGMSEKTVYLSPAPLYHAAPLRWAMAVQRLGGTVVVMTRFDAENALQLIERYQVTHSQWVPTHFVRMLRLPEAARGRYDLSSHEVAIHAAAPCPIPVKEAMIDWWGPVVFEYYGGTEGAGFCLIGPEEWLSHKGSVGKSMRGTLRICDENGDELPVGQIGDVYFDGGPDFSYHNDPEKTAASMNKHGWRTMGDVGYQDEDGYLYLTDRKKFMIISGGVNIYPQEIENAFLGHPDVQDVAVFGLPDDEFGEKVIAVIEPRDWASADQQLIETLAGYIREKISRVKVPKEIMLEQALPREPTGKLMKRHLRDELLAKSSQQS